MRFFVFLFIISTSLFFFSNCTTDSTTSVHLNLNGTFNKAGLEGTNVNSFNRLKSSVYVATDHGLHKQTIGNTSWDSLGLQQKQVLKVVFLPKDSLLASIRISDFSSGIASLFLSTDNGGSWQPYINNYGGETGQYTWVESMAAASTLSDTLFTGASGGVIVRSINGGQDWTVVNGGWSSWGGGTVVIKPDPYKKKRVWAGGWNAFFQPVFLKSTDGGTTWQRLTVIENVETTVYDVATYPSEPSRILVGMDIGIRKSTDGGENWEASSQGINTYTLTHSARDAEVVYASGQNTAGTLFFIASADFGDTWQTVDMPGSPTGIYVNDMVSVMQDGHEVLYLGTNNGVYTYSFEQ